MFKSSSGLSAPCATDGLFYVLLREEAICAIDPATGRILRKVNTWAGDKSLLVERGVAYLWGDQRIASVDLRSGSTNWSLDIAPEKEPVLDGDTIWFVSRGGSVVAVDRATGELRSSLAVRSGVIAPPILTARLVVFGDREGWIHAVDRSTSQEVWAVRCGDRLSAPPEFLNGSVLCSGEIHDTTIWHSPFRRIRFGHVGIICSIQPDTGRKVWEFREGCLSPLPRMMSLNGNVVFANTYFIYSLGEASGTLDRRIALDAYPISSPMQWNGLVVLAVRAFDQSPGWFQFQALSASTCEKIWQSEPVMAAF